MFKILIIILLLLYVAFAILLYFKQNRLLYYPTPDIETEYSGFFIQQDSAKIYIHTLNKGHKNAILYFGGNAESMAKSSDYIAKQFQNFTCYLMDYRGYGSSGGEPSQKAIYADALTLYDMVKQNHKSINIGGRSLGTAVSTYVASKREVRRLALITPFDSIEAVAKERYPIYPVSLFLKDSYKSIDSVKSIKAKTFIVMAQNDKIVSKERTERLIEAFKEANIDLKVATINNRGHNDISDDERYYRIMQEFIGEH